METARQFLISLLDRAIAAADPTLCVPPNLPPRPKGRIIVVGAGKASAAMAAAVEKHTPGPLSGLVITRYGHAVPCRQIEIVEAAHPVPDERGLRAAQKLAALLDGLHEEDLVLCLISGGGSSLLTAPARGLGLADEQEVNRVLLGSGAPIGEMNCLRKHISSLKGGRLAARAFPARVLSLIISDVPGDDPAVIASGPTVPDPTTRQDALAIVRKYELKLPSPVIEFLSSPEAETPKADDPRLARAGAKIIATASLSLAAAAAAARNAGWNVLNLGDRIEGEARLIARRHASISAAPHSVVLSGGETTVTIRGRGRGGRNTEYLLSLALALGERNGRFAIAADTDGIDGSESNAGAIITPDTLARAKDLGLDPSAHLVDNNAYAFFEKLGDLVVTGPTLTNVNDFRAMLID